MGGAKPGCMPRTAAGTHGSLLRTSWDMVCGKSDFECQGHKGQKGQRRRITKDASSRHASEPGQKDAPDFFSPHLQKMFVPGPIHMLNSYSFSLNSEKIVFPGGAA